MAQNLFDQFDAPASGANIFDQFDEGAKDSGGFASDIGKSLKVGVQELPGMATGLADLPFALATGARPFTKAADVLGEATGFQPGKWAKDTKFSAGYEQGKANIDKAWEGGSAGDIALEYLKNPGYTAQQVVQSVPGMVAGGFGSKLALGAGRIAAPLAKAGGVGPSAPGLLARTVGEKWAVPLAAGAGEGAVTAGQQMAQYQGDDQQKNALAALAAGAGTAAIGVGAGRLANALGLETAETAIAKIGSKAAGAADEIPLSAKQRILGGIVSEAVLQEMPQSAQEQMWQNYADGKPIMEGVARATVEGGLAGGVMGAAANVRGPRAERGPAPEQDAPPGDPTAPPTPMLGNTPDPLISFRDGSVARQSEVDAYLNSLPEDQRAAARAKLMGLAAQPADIGTSLGAADPSAPQREGVAAPQALDATTAPGAAPEGGNGVDFTREFDTAGLNLQDPAEADRARSATVDYAPADTTPNWGTAQGAAPARQGLDMPAQEIDTSGLSLDQRTPSQRMGIDPNTGPLSSAAAMAVDSGAHAQAQQDQALQAAAEIAQKQRPAKNQEQPNVGPSNQPSAGLLPLGGPAGNDAGRGVGTAGAVPRDAGRRDAGASLSSLASNGELGAAPTGQRGNGNAPLTAPANLRDGLARIRAQRQEAADAQTAAQSAPTSAPAVSAAGTPAVQADGAKPSREVADAAGIATSVLGEDMAAKNRFADFADAHAGKPAGEVQSLLAASEFGPKLAGNELAQISDQISKSGSGVASQARANAAPQVEASDSQKLANKIKFQKIRVEQAGAAVASAQDVDQFGLPIENGPKKQAAKARLQKAEADLAALESTQPPANNNARTTTSAPAAPAAGLPAAGTGAVEAAGLPPRGREGYDTPVTLDAASLKALVEKTRGTPLVDKPEKLEAWRNGTAKTDPAKFPIELAITPDGRLDVNDGRHRIALAAERGETVEAFIDGKDAHYAQQLVSQPSQPTGAPNVPQAAQAQQSIAQSTQARGAATAGPAAAATAGQSATVGGSGVQAAGVSNAATAQNAATSGKDAITAELSQLMSARKLLWSDIESAIGRPMNMDNAMARVIALKYLKRNASDGQPAATAKTTQAAPAPAAQGTQALSWAGMTPDQRKRSTLEREIATGTTNNGGVVASLRPSAIEKRKQALAAMGDAGLAQAAPTTSQDRHPNWRKNAIQAGRVARELGLAPKGKRLAQIVAEVDAKDAEQKQAVAPISKAQAATENVAPTADELKAQRAAAQQAEAAPAPAQQEASKPKKLPPFPVDGYRLERYYANGAKVKPLPAKAFSPTEVQAITDWFKSIGWSVTSGSGANGVNATNDVGMTVDDLPEPYTAAQRKKDEAQKAADERAADKQKAQDDYLASNDAGKFVSDMFGDSMNRFNLTALAKVLAGDEKTFGGLFSNRAADVLADAGISTEGRQVKDVVADIKATFDAAQQQVSDDFLPEGWTKSVNGYTKRPVYRMEQGGGQPFAVVTQVEGMRYEVQIRHGDKQLIVSNQTGALSEVLAKAEAELTRMTQADSVTHQDPGEKAEAATPGVVTDSLKKAARNEDTKPSEMRKWLVAEIDKELLQAADRPDYDEAVKRMGEKDAISMFTGNGPLGKNSETGYITFDVPGDGKYKVRNSVRGLLEFRKNVMASQGFKDSGQKRAKPEQNDGVQGGSGGQMAAIANMIEEGDFEAARDYAEAVGIARLFVSRTPKNRDVLFAEQDGKLREVISVSAEQKAQWERFMRDGTLPTPPDTKPQPAPKTTAQKNSEKAAPVEEQSNPAEFTHNGTRIYPVNIKLGDSVEAMWGVESAENKAKREAGERTIGGDSLHETRDAAIKAAEREAKSNAQSEAYRKEREEIAKKEKAAKEAKAADTINGFTEGMAPNTAALAAKALEKEVRFKGEVASIRSFIDKWHEAGTLEVSTTQEPRIKPMSRTAYNRADNKAQDEHERRMKEAGNKTVYWVNDIDLGKIAHDYAQHMLEQEAKPVDGFVESDAAESDYASTAEQVEAAQELLLPIRQGEMITDDVRQTLESLLKIPSLKGFDQPTARRLLMIAGATKAAIEKVMRTNPVSIDDLATELGKATGEAEKKKAFDRAFNAASQIAQTDPKVKELLDIYNVEKSILDGIASERGLYGVKWAERNVSSRWTGQSQKVRSVKQRLVDAVNKAAPSGVRQGLAGARAKKAAETANPKPTDSAYHYSDGNMGMTSGGSFTADKSRWMTFTKSEAERMVEGDVKPYGATRVGMFVGIDSGVRLEVSQPRTAKNTITPEDVAAAEKQAIAVIEKHIDAMKAGALNAFAKKFLPTMGMKALVSKERNKAMLTDASKVNLLGVAGELGVELVPSVRRALDAEMQGKVADAGQDDGVNNYLDTLFGGGSESASAAQAAPSKRRIDAKKIVPALRQLADQKQAEADDWAGRVYRNNTTQIDLRGDGPSRQDSMSTNSVNESRRRRAVEALTQQANAASKLADRVENGTIDIQSRLDSISDTVDSDMRRDGGRPMIGASRADMFEGYISNNLLGDDNYGHGEGTVARMLREAYEGKEQAALQPAAPAATIEDAGETKQTDKGVAMFSRTGAQSANANKSTSRAWYDRFVSLLPEAYRNDPHRREPLPAEDWNVQRAAEVRGKVEALNKQLRGENDRKGYGPISIDGLGNLQVSAQDVSVADLDGPIKTLANELGAGIAVTNVRSADARALQNSGFVPESSLAAIADRLMQRPFASPTNNYAKDSAPGAIMTYKPRGFPAALFARDVAQNNATPALSRADSNAQNVATQMMVDGLTEKWTRVPEIIVARNMQDPQIPQEVRDYDAELKSQGSDGEARGFIYKGKVYLLSDQLKGPQQIAEVLFHEVLGHYGLRGVFGKGLDSILQQLGTMRRKDVVTKAREYGLFDKDALGGLDKAAASDAQIWAAMSAKDRLSAAEEVLAEMAQTQPTIGFVKRAIALIRNWLRANVPGFDKLALTDADIIQAYILPARGFVTRSKETGAQSLERAMLAFSRAYHGTPHRGIERFSADKIGTGEGAQAYGWGLYFASKRGIAEHYRKALQTVTRGGLFYKDKPLTRRAMNDLARSGSATEQAVFGAKWPSKDIEKEMVKRAAEYEADAATKLAQGTTISNQWAAEYSRRASAIRTVLADMERRAERENGQLYEVEIPEDSEMLLWDKPLAEAPEGVRDAVYGMGLQGRWMNGASGERVFIAPPTATMSGKQAYARISRLLGSDQAASEALAAAGVKGIKYLDGTSRKDGDGSYNYVVFNGDDVQIERAHFSRTPGGKTQTEAFKRWFAGSKVVDADGKPLVVYHGTIRSFDAFDKNAEPFSYESDRGKQFFLDSSRGASDYAIGTSDAYGGNANVMPVYLRMENPRIEEVDGPPSEWWDENGDDLYWKLDVSGSGHDGLIVRGDSETMYVTTNPRQIKSAIGNSGAFDPANPDIRFSRTSPIESSMGALNAQQEAAYRNVAGVKRIPTIKERADAFKANLGLRMKQALVDQFAPIKDVSQEAYMLSRMSKGSDGAIDATLLYGKPFLRDGVLDVNIQDGGFAKVLASLKGEHDRFFMWVAAQRGERLKDEGKENLMGDADISALKTLNQGQMVDGTARIPLYANALRELNDFNEASLKVALQSGLIDQTTYDTMKDQPYVPFYRLMEDEGAMTGPRFSSGLLNQQAWKKLKGGTQQLNADLMENTLLNWSHLYAASARNRAALSTMDAAEAMGVAYKVNAYVKGSVKVMRDGMTEHWMVEDPYLLEAVSALNYSASPLMKPLATMKKLLTWGVTVNPTFKIRNLIRDSVSAIAQSDLGFNPAGNVLQGWKLTAKDSQVYASMLASGGVIKFGTQENSERLRRQVADLGGVMLDKNGLDKLKGQLKTMYEAYQEIGDRTENVNRAALYDQLIKNGKSHAEASFMARDLMDFSMGGSHPAVRFLTQTAPFLNARLQGLYKLGRAAQEDPKKFAAVTGAVALASLALMAAYSDDDDWKKREDWDRDAYWWFKIGDTAYRIPKPFEVGAIGTLAERTAELMFNKEMTNKRFMERIGFMAGQTFSFDPVPQAVKPLLDVYANKDSFTQRPIESQADQRLRPQDRYNERTSEVARLLGSWGLPDPGQLIKGDYAGLSPKQIDHLLRGYFSWVATASTTASDFLIRPALDRGTRPEMRLRDTFLAGNFVEGLPTGSSRYVTQLYEQSKAVEQAYASYRDAIKSGDMEKARSIQDSDGPKLRNHMAYAHATKQLSEINAQAKRIESNKIMSGEVKRERLTELELRRDQVARRVAALT